jgi:hypothetical protein
MPGVRDGNRDGNLNLDKAFVIAQTLKVVFSAFLR